MDTINTMDKSTVNLQKFLNVMNGVLVKSKMQAFLL